MALRIPWPIAAAWSMEITLSGRVYRLRGKWNDNEFWTLDILTRDNEPILLGRKIQAGVNLTGRFADRRLPPGGLFIIMSKGCGCTPGFEDMRENARLIYVPTV